MRHRIRVIQPCKQSEQPNWNRLNLCSIQWLRWLSKGVHHQTRQTAGQVVGFLLQNPTLLDPTIIFLRCLNIHLDSPSPSQSPPKLAKILQSSTRSGGSLTSSFFPFQSKSIELTQIATPENQLNLICLLSNWWWVLFFATWQD